MIRFVSRYDCVCLRCVYITAPTLKGIEIRRRKDTNNYRWRHTGLFSLQHTYFVFATRSMLSRTNRKVSKLYSELLLRLILIYLNAFFCLVESVLKQLIATNSVCITAPEVLGVYVSTKNPSKVSEHTRVGKILFSKVKST